MLQVLPMVPLVAVAVLGIARAAESTHGGGACGAEADCSLAGDCTQRKCVCDPWATGAHCQLLNFRMPEPVTPPPPAPPARYFWTDGRCLATNDTDAAQCPNPPPLSTGPTCPVFLTTNCSGANSVWIMTPSLTNEGTDMINARSGAALNIDFDSCAAGTIAHTFHTGNEIEYHNISVSGGPCTWQTVLKFMQAMPSRSACGGSGMCLNDGTGAARPPSRPTEHVVDGQVKLASCTDASATGWRRVFVPPPPAPSCNFKADTSGHGNSLGSNINNVSSKEACCALCHENPACGGWTWGNTVVHGVCFLRRPGTRWYPQVGAWSGTGPAKPAPPTPPAPPPQLTVSSVFSSSMVLQRDQPVAFWGWTAKAADTVTASFNGKQYRTQSASNLTAPGGALWAVTLASTPASAAGLTINVTCGACAGNDATLSLHDILVGDVHLCSGQSNMEFAVQQSFNGTTTELVAADTYTTKPIRVFKFQGEHSRDPVEQPGFQGSWSTVNRKTIGSFSAVCWFGGRDTFDALGGAVPLGLIESDVGGTGIEFWSPTAAIAECSQVTPSTKGPNPQSDSTLYNGWIAPFTVGPMALKSLVWYQGESNTCPQGGGRPCGGTYYKCQFAAMIRHWRRAFGNDTLPFTFVLLAPDQKENAVADIRYGQLAALNISHTAVVNAMDDGDCTPEYCAVHVRDKQLVGARLAAVLLGLLYRGGVSAYAPSQTPLVSNWSASPTGLTVHFTHTGSWLETVTSGRQVVCGGNTTKWKPSDGHVISGGTNWWPINTPGRPGPSLCAGFEMRTTAGSAEWLPARPSVGRNGSSLEFLSPSNGDAVTAVRYAQSDWPLVTLYTKEGMPAAPFQIPEEHFVGPH